MKKKEITSEAKKKMLEFCYSEYESDFVFYLECTTTKEAEKFVHNMRVELSRLRKYAESKGRVLIPFKMKLQGYESGEFITEDEDEEGNKSIVKKYMKVILKKSKSKDTVLQEGVNEALDVVTTGETVDV